MIERTHGQWLEQDFNTELEVRVKVEWKYRIDKDRVYFHVFLGELEITDALSKDEKGWVEGEVLDAINVTMEEYNE